MKPNPTLEQVKRGMEWMFIPNIIITWDEKFRMYLVKPHVHTINEMVRLNYTADEGPDISGVAWIKRWWGLRLPNGKHIAESQLDEALNSMGRCGITYQITPKPEDDETTSN
jgi:hypothetical protein